VVVEYIILLAFMVLVVASLFVNTLKGTFRESGPMLGARIEKHIETGSGFPLRKDGNFPWEPAPKKAGEVQ
jgi:hypothetical protein